jgi:hypothetical protein
MSTATFYPDADPETTSVDGYAANTPGVDDTWSAFHDAAAGSASSDDAGVMIVGAYYGSTGWAGILRAFLLFDTSSLPDGATITAASLHLYGDHFNPKIDSPGAASEPQLDVVGSTPASDTAIDVNDFPNIGTTRYAAGTDFSSLVDDGWNVIALNATGIAAISLAGITKLGLRVNCDTDNSEPDSSLGFDARFFPSTADNSNSARKPYLEVTYTVPATALDPSSYQAQDTHRPRKTIYRPY